MGDEKKKVPERIQSALEELERATQQALLTRRTRMLEALAELLRHTAPGSLKAKMAEARLHAARAAMHRRGRKPQLRIRESWPAGTHYFLGYSAGTTLCEAAMREGASEAELAALRRLRDGVGEARDVLRLAPLARITGLPWAELFPELHELIVEREGRRGYPR